MLNHLRVMNWGSQVWKSFSLCSCILKFIIFKQLTSSYSLGVWVSWKMQLRNALFFRISSHTIGWVNYFVFEESYMQFSMHSTTRLETNMYWRHKFPHDCYRIYAIHLLLYPSNVQYKKRLTTGLHCRLPKIWHMKNIYQWLCKKWDRSSGHES